MRPHTAIIIPGSTQRHPETHGIAFNVECCGEHRYSVHIQNVHRFSTDELFRMREDALTEVAEQHEKILAAEEFLKACESNPASCGCK